MSIYAVEVRLKPVYPTESSNDQGHHNEQAYEDHIQVEGDCEEHILTDCSLDTWSSDCLLSPKSERYPEDAEAKPKQVNRVPVPDETKDTGMSNNANYCDYVNTVTINISCNAIFLEYSSLFFEQIPLEVDKSSRYVSPNAQEHIVFDKPVELCLFWNVNFRHLVPKVWFITFTMLWETDFLMEWDILKWGIQTHIDIYYGIQKIWNTLVSWKSIGHALKKEGWNH